MRMFRFSGPTSFGGRGFLNGPKLETSTPFVLEHHRAGRAPVGYHILSGKSPRGEFLHSVVANGEDIVHDPHPVARKRPRSRRLHHHCADGRWRP